MPPSVSDWLCEDHLARFIVDCVEHLDLRDFYACFRSDGRGHAAYDPAMLLALLLYCYAIGVRSSRQIERNCQEHVALRFITANVLPDHCTIARFRQKFAPQITRLFVEILALCDKAKLIKLGAVAIDGTKLKANAAMAANGKREHFEKLVEQILKEAQEIDAQEDRKFGEDKRGDEPPDWMKDSQARQAKIRAFKEEMERAKKAEAKNEEHKQKVLQEYEEAKAAYEKKVAEKKPRGKRPSPPGEDKLDIKVNGTDPDSRIQKVRAGGHIQGYNCQAAVDADTQIILAADVVDSANDTLQLPHMVDETLTTLTRAGLPASKIQAVVADAGYWGHGVLAKALQLLSNANSEAPAQLLVAVPQRYQKLPGAVTTETALPPNANIYVQHEYKQRCPAGQAIFHKRARSIESVFGQIKSLRRIDQFQQRGITRVRAEWLLSCLTHNLLKLWRHKTRSAPAPNRQKPWKNSTMCFLNDSNSNWVSTAYASRSFA